MQCSCLQYLPPYCVQASKDGCSSLKTGFKQEVSQTRFLLNGHQGAIYVDIKRNVTDKDGETAYFNF